MADNVLMRITQSVSIQKDLGEVCVEMYELFENTDKLYSYIVYAKYDDEDLSGWVVNYIVSQNEDYNTLSPDEVVTELLQVFSKKENNGKKVICYKQPSIEIMLEVYDPLVHRLAKYQQDRWRQFEHDDLCQICRMVMIRLYKKGYYIHKRLLYKAFMNEILISTRHERNAPKMVSFEDAFFTPIKGDSEKLLIADIVADESITEKEEEDYKNEVNLKVFEEVKDIIVEFLGERQWRELYRSYTTKNTTTTTRKLMQRVKTYFEKLGISRKDFDNKYYG